MESIFSNVGFGGGRTIGMNDPDNYEAKIKALIADAEDYDRSEVSPEREENLKYYKGIAPSLDDLNDQNIEGEEDPEDAANRSTAVSTDVKDTVMAILPSLIRIFASTENVIEMIPSTAKYEESSRQALDDVTYTFWEDNDGFMLLHSVFKDTMTQKVGVVKWWTEDYQEVTQKEFRNITMEELQNLLTEYQQGEQGIQCEIIEGGEVTGQTPEGEPMVGKVLIQYVKTTPRICIKAVPPENFRIDRRAESAKRPRLIGTAEIISSSDVVKMGYDPEFVQQYLGQYDYFRPETMLRNPGIDTSVIDRDLVEYGEYYIMIDSDGDGIDELHRIRTIGTDYDILEDIIVDDHNLAVFSGDPVPHAVIGDCVADLVKDIQRIKTQLLRGALDSLSGSLFADTIINETLVNVDDVLSDGVARVIRTKGNVNDSVRESRASFVGADVFEMMATIDVTKQSRTGISEASKGVDPKALQSTTLMGVDAIVTGAQERIELIARILAETGFKDLMRGIFREIVRAPNRKRTVRMQGKWTSFNPSLYDPNMTVRVNPTLGKGSDITRMTALNDIQQTQMMIITQMGITNPFVTPQQYMNTVTDKLAMANIKDTSRYFNEITPEVMEQLNAPPEPTPEQILAQSTLEEVKSKVANNIAEQDFKRTKLQVDDDFRRDQLGLTSLIQAITAFSQFPGSEEKVPEAAAIVEKGNQPG